MRTPLWQAWARGKRARRIFKGRRQLDAAVSGSRMLEGGGGGRETRVPVYVITAVRAGCSWKVEHRFSDWIELDARLAPHLPGRPALPPRMPFRGRRVVAYRKVALNSWLQKVLVLTESAPIPRCTLIDFLSASHLYWIYECGTVRQRRRPVPRCPIPTQLMHRPRALSTIPAVGPSSPAVSGCASFTLELLPWSAWC